MGASLQMRLALSIISVLLLSEVQFFVQCTNKYCNQGKNCRIEKDCFCASRSYPLPLKDTPQFIYFGFDDAVTKLLQMDVYDYIFQSGRKNPNGCPISFSLYVSHNYTDYSLVRRYYNLGLEIGSHSVTHTRLSNKTDLEREARKQKDNLVRLAGVDKSDIRGWRSPFLQTAGDWQPYVLKKLGYEYDISMSIARLSLLASFRVSDGFFWSFAYGLPKGCSLFCDLLAKGWHRKMTLDCVFPGHVWINFCVSNFRVAWCLMRGHLRVWMLVCPAVVAPGDGACDDDVSAVSLKSPRMISLFFGVTEEIRSFICLAELVFHRFIRVKR
ncbi:unnamed protein product [Acanthosepion pharaonis]|uniref:NodB homology domain-containing protein n=1 Tax=Acanthosepion pharaonis TaxID=158019 RepID=A0A812D075_ACAPH|nr:unnamed protein product [Sepia pharaonis]